jgi:hypothetical protein
MVDATGMTRTTVTEKEAIKMMSAASTSAFGRRSKKRGFEPVCWGACSSGKCTVSKRDAWCCKQLGDVSDYGGYVQAAAARGGAASVAQDNFGTFQCWQDPEYKLGDYDSYSA